MSKYTIVLSKKVQKQLDKFTDDIAKPILWENKRLIATSEAVIIKLLPRSETMTPDDDKYFEQLQ